MVLVYLTRLDRELLNYLMHLLLKPLQEVYSRFLVEGPAPDAVDPWKGSVVIQRIVNPRIAIEFLILPALDLLINFLLVFLNLLHYIGIQIVSLGIDGYDKWPKVFNLKYP
jgi:hypothetical protein